MFAQAGPIHGLDIQKFGCGTLLFFNEREQNMRGPYESLVILFGKCFCPVQNRPSRCAQRYVLHANARFTRKRMRTEIVFHTLEGEMGPPENVPVMRFHFQQPEKEMS